MAVILNLDDVHGCCGDRTRAGPVPARPDGRRTVLRAVPRRLCDALVACRHGTAFSGPGCPNPIRPEARLSCAVLTGPGPSPSTDCLADATCTFGFFVLVPSHSEDHTEAERRISTTILRYKQRPRCLPTQQQLTMAARNGASQAKLPMSGPQVCKPFVGPLTVTKKAFGLSAGDYNVTDANGAVVLRVKGEFFSSRRRRVVLDAAGRILLTLRGKAFSFHSSWEVFKGGSTNASNLLFTVKRSSVFQLNASLHVFLAGNTSEQVCDFKVKGSYFNRSCAFYHGTSNIMIAQMNRQFVLLGKDTCCVTVIPNVDHAFITSLVVILDEINQ